MHGVAQGGVCVKIDQRAYFSRDIHNLLAHIVGVVVAPQGVLVKLHDFLIQSHESQQIVNPYFRRHRFVFIERCLCPDMAQVGDSVRSCHSLVCRTSCHGGNLAVHTGWSVSVESHILAEELLIPCAGCGETSVAIVKVVAVAVHVVTDE